jgi:hypothetical protein
MAQNTLIDLMREHASRASDPNVPGIPGMIEPGNIDHIGRPVVSLGDGRTGTVLAMSFEEDGREVLIPTIYDGKKHKNDEAIAHYHRTGEHLGVFETPDQATAFSKALSNALGDEDLKHLFTGPPRPR